MAVTENDVTLFKKIEDIFPLDPKTIFDYYNRNSEFRTLYEQIKNFLDINIEVPNSILMDYMTRFSQRTLSNAVKKNLQWYGIDTLSGVYVPSQSSISIVSNAIFEIYYRKWKISHDSFNTSYNPIKPLEMTSNYNTIIDHMETVSNSDNSRNKSGNSADNNETEYDNTDNKIYGFNSADGVNSDSSKNTSKDNSNGTFESSDIYKGKDTYSRDANSQRTITRSGNIGNRLPSEMLLKEIEFRRNMMRDIISNDINAILTRSKYI